MAEPPPPVQNPLTMVMKAKSADDYAALRKTVEHMQSLPPDRNPITVALNKIATVNCALHMIAVTQARGIGPGKTYMDKLLASGKTRTEALRLLRRQLSDVAYRALLTDERAAAQQGDDPPDEILPHAA
ncbi:MAG: hypothetical protein M3143_08360 [Actinomycetota bacterium]|nr:hypothetical protein [Actinomycetota bacterium]